MRSDVQQAFIKLSPLPKVSWQWQDTKYRVSGYHHVSLQDIIIVRKCARFLKRLRFLSRVQWWLMVVINESFYK